ncbi:acetyltransferase [Kitasatospora griseola]|uniref:Acetyltransferase n=1 Tax=Kitasatospora griseola TaxID=2064 RepID=A0A0D0PVX1_KITGR|nr:GNAT family protein [Kitasatospora griseola]KIQ64537.1 acetyltransferase [Kitasatospora griseola]GGQ73685.1 N-acetyltransferase [Kitasatospora griseola]
MTSYWLGERVRLRAVETGDGPLLARLSEQEERLGDLLNPPRSTEGWQTFAREHATADPSGDTYTLIVESRADGTPVGSVGVHRADPRNGWFEYGITVAAEHRRRGYAGEAVRLVVRHQFEERRYRKATARVFAHNHPSLELHRHLGFTEEGRLRGHAFLWGRPVDVVLLALFAEDFTARHGASAPH